MFRSLVTTSAAAALLAGVAAAPASAATPVFYTDANGGPVVRPVFIDGNSNVRSGPFRRWRGWGTDTARASSRSSGSFSTRVVLTDLTRCAGRRQYRRLVVLTYEGGQRVGRAQRFTNRACS